MVGQTSEVWKQTPVLALGEELVRDGLITPAQQKTALLRQQQSGLQLGRILSAMGWLRECHLYSLLAKRKGAIFVDLEQEPPQPGLMRPEELSSYIRHGALPWRRREDGGITVAITEDGAETEHWLLTRYGANVQYVMTTPRDIRHCIANAFAGALDYQSRHFLAAVYPECSAHTLLSLRDGIILCGFLTLLAGACILSPFLSYIALIVLNLFFCFTLLFRLTLFVVGACTRPYRHHEKPAQRLPDENLPVYTILVPLYDEAASLPGLAAAIGKLDYPKEKLDVKLILEEDDQATWDAAVMLNLPDWFHIIRVPPSLPRTKPKACNYVLPFARGDFLTIYDAEDRPDTLQLRKVLAEFSRSSPQVACLQAQLNYYNRNENLLTRWFALEYAGWFHYMLWGLQRLGVPIPLGGTSNHIRTDVLRRVGAWDPYNVTEDADLGIRLAMHGYQTRMVDSTTMEEAPLRLMPWIRQRSRWIKGYMQTWLVHMRRPLTLYRHTGLAGFLGFQLFVGGPCLVFLLTPWLWMLVLLSLTSSIYFPYLTALPPWLEGLFLLNIALGLALPACSSAWLARRHRWEGMLTAVCTFPFYWFLHSAASLRALWQLLSAPHYWDKTVHGRTRYGSSAMQDSSQSFNL